MELSDKTLSFLQASLGSASFEILPLAGDASSRRYHRVIVEEQSQVLMSWEPFADDGSYPFLSVLRHLQRHEVQVPKVMGYAPELGLVLLEDLGDLTLERKFWENQDQHEAAPFYEMAIDELIKIHYPATADRGDCTAFKIEFNTERLLWEMNYGREHLLEGLGKLELSPAAARELEQNFIEICTCLDQEPKFIAHRDYHARNLMIKLGKMRVIDFQDARLGPVQYDLVSLLKDSYVALQDGLVDDLIKYYLLKRQEFFSDSVDRDHFNSIFQLQILQRCFKACGSFASFYNLRSDTRYLKYIQPTLTSILKTLRETHRFSTFLGVLEDSGILEKSFAVQ